MGNLDHAQAYVVEEASGIREATLISSVLPSDTRDALRKEIGNYLHFVDQVDWPAIYGHLLDRRGLVRCPTDDQ